MVQCCSQWGQLCGNAEEPLPRQPQHVLRRRQQGTKGLLENLRCSGTSDVPWGLTACSPQLFLKEQLYQALESKRARAHHLAALTLQRYARTFFIKKRFRSLRRKIVLLQSRARGYLAR